MTKTLFFDLDGTLSDTRLGIFNSYRYTCTELQLLLPSEERLLSFIGPPLRNNMIYLLGGNEEKADEAITLYRHYYDALGGMQENTPYQGMAETLNVFSQKGCRMFVATAKAEHVARPLIEHLGMSKHFHGIYGSRPDGLPPKDEIIARLMDSEKLDPQNCAMIGDRRHDIMAAKKNGVKAIGVTWGYGSQEELEEAGADRLAFHPSELPTVV